jgi:hypothetical protein
MSDLPVDKWLNVREKAEELVEAASDATGATLYPEKQDELVRVLTDAIEEVFTDEEGSILLCLTGEQIDALYHAWAIEEYPTSNPLSNRGGDVLAVAQAKLVAARPSLAGRLIGHGED